MCVSPIHTCLFIGMLMPAMRAIVLQPSPRRRMKKRGILRVTQVITKSALALLVARVAADDVDHATAAHDLAVLADLLHRRTNFHCMRSFITRPSRGARSRAGSPS